MLIQHYFSSQLVTWLRAHPFALDPPRHHSILIANTKTMTINSVAGPSNAHTISNTNANARANGGAPLSKNAKRRLKKKQQHQQPESSGSSYSIPRSSTSTSTLKQTVQVSYDDDDAPTETTSIIDQAAHLHIDPDSETYKAFSSVLSRYQPHAVTLQQQTASKGEIIYSDDDIESDEHDSTRDDSHADSAAAAHSSLHLSKRKQKKLQRLTVAELKQLVSKPEVVEWTDVTSDDPRLLVHLRCVRNSVPIPPHWANKRDYLQNKRGIEKPAYQLPSYIAETGIATIKDALNEKEADYTLKQKTRDRVQPKMGKIEIDYQKLYDAFFKFQSKPSLSMYGDVYYEGKDFETKYKDKRPGQLSSELIEALSIPPLAPPPWLIAMQRYGPPPSYPHLQIPGLNAPIPQGATWGFHPGGWGRPPVDEYGQPLYANVLANPSDTIDDDLIDRVDKQPWGALQPEQSDHEDDDDDDDDDDQVHDDVQQAQGAASPSAQLDVSGLQSVSSAAGIETPMFTELRKHTRDDKDSNGQSVAPPTLYQVVPERSAVAGAGAGQLMASERVYDLSSAQQPTTRVGVLGAEHRRGTKRDSDAVHVSIDPEELHAESDLAARYDAERRNHSASRFAAYTDDQHAITHLRHQLQKQRSTDHHSRPNPHNPAS